MAEHLHSVIDDDLHFKIDPNTRRVYRTSEDPIVLVQHDHNSERISFEIPREIDGHDMTQCNKVRIHFLNFDAANPEAKFAGVYESTDLGALAGDNDTLLFTWLVHMDSTGYAGPLNFAVSFVCTDTKTDADGRTTIVTTYSWNTLPNTEDIGVSDGMNHAQDLQEDYYDVIDDWINRINERGGVAIEDITAHTDRQKLSVEVSINNAVETAEQDIREYAIELKEAMNKFSLSEMGLLNQSTGTSTATVMSQDATTKAVEDAKAFASAEASDVRSDLNARYSELEDMFESYRSRYIKKEYDNANTGVYYLEKGTKYRILHPNGDTYGKWGFSIQIQCRYSVTGTRTLLVTPETTESLIAPNITFNTYGVSPNTDAPTYYQVALPYTKYDTEYPCTDYPNYSNGLDFRVISYHLKVGTQNSTKYGVQQRLIYEINGKPYTKTWVAPEDQLFGAISADPTIESFNIVVTGRDAVVYEDTESITSSIPAYTVNANGISDIYKTATNGLVDTYTIVLDDGTTKTFTVTNGSIGPDGMSAYEIALKNGFKGTEQDWLKSLGGSAQVNPDYEENNRSSKAYIKNRPFYDYRSVISEDPVYVWDKASSLFDGELGYTYNNSTSSTISLDNYAVGIKFSDSTGTTKTELHFLSEFRSAELENQCGVLLTYKGLDSYCNAYVVIVDDYAEFAAKYNSDVSANGIYLGSHTEYIDGFQNNTVSSEINVLYTYKGYFKKLDNKFLDLKNNDDFKALESKVGSGGGTGSGGNANVFAGTWAEYYAANAAGEIPEGMVILITDEEDAGTVALLGQAILGQMLLG